MAKKSQLQKRTKKIQFRLTEPVYNRIRGLANLYADGNVSAWLVHGGLNAPRRFLPSVRKKFH